MKLLRIDSSPRTNGSHSKELADMLEVKLQSTYSNLNITNCDLSTKELPHINQEYIDAALIPKIDRTPDMNKVLSLADSCITDIKNADIVLISVPMYNFNIPSTLKVYIDYISRFGETVIYDESGFKGLLTNKKLIITAAYGADFSQMKEMDFVEPYLKSVFNFLGFSDITYLAIEGTSQLTTEALREKKEKLLNDFSYT